MTSHWRTPAERRDTAGCVAAWCFGTLLVMLLVYCLVYYWRMTWH